VSSPLTLEPPVPLPVPLARLSSCRLKPCRPFVSHASRPSATFVSFVTFVPFVSFVSFVFPFFGSAASS